MKLFIQALKEALDNVSPSKKMFWTVLLFIEFLIGCGLALMFYIFIFTTFILNIKSIVISISLIVILTIALVLFVMFLADVFDKYHSILRKEGKF